MLRKLILAGCFALLGSLPVYAQATVEQCFRATPTGFCQAVNGSNPLPVAASASISGFHPEVALAQITATTGGVTSAAFTAGKTVVVSNVGTINTAYCLPGVVATTQVQPIAPNGGWFAFTTTSETAITCATSTGTTAVNLVVGTGLPTGTGGGASGGGGGGAVTVADGADVTQGEIADAAVAAGAAGTANAHLRSISRDVMSVNTWASGTLGVMANYGTSPGAVLVPGVNAFVTNTLAGITMGDNVTTGNFPTGSPVFSGLFNGTSYDRPRSGGVMGMAGVNLQASPTGGCTPAKTLSAATTNSTSIKGSFGTLCKMIAINTTAALYYLKMYNTAAAPTCNSDTVVATYPVPPSNGGVAVNLGPFGEAYTNGIGFCLTANLADNDNTAAATGVTISYSSK